MSHKSGIKYLIFKTQKVTDYNLKTYPVVLVFLTSWLLGIGALKSFYTFSFSGNSPTLYDTQSSPNVVTRPNCWSLSQAK